MKTGLDVLHSEGYQRLEGKRVGLLTNPSALNRELISTYQLFAQHVNLTALFGPEHGFAGAAPDAAKVDSTVDPRTGVPVHSLYGATYRPTPDMLQDVDILVCDIQDIGVRYYTYTWTVSYVLEAAGEHGVEVMILDRPNPLGGLIVDGPALEPELASFVGRFPVPVQHGMTLGELALMINAVWNPHPAALSIVACTGWHRAMTWPQTGMPWVPPSPNMPHLSTLQHYPGACLIEGTTLSEGRGTALPFEVVGAPWIDGHALAEALNANDWPGVRFRPHSFLPCQSKWAHQYCHGVQVYITEPEAWRPLLVWLGIIMTIRSQYPDHFEWIPDHFDRLIGSRGVRHRIETGTSLETIANGWDIDFDRQRFLLYD